MSDPEAKRDWLTDVRLAKLALDRGNNPAWDTDHNREVFGHLAAPHGHDYVVDVYYRGGVPADAQPTSVIQIGERVRSTNFCSSATSSAPIALP